MPQRDFNHISIVVMTFKCHTGLDTCITITPGEHFYTSLCKQRAPLSFVIQQQSIVISGEQRRTGMSTTEAPKAVQSMQRSLSNPAPFFLPNPYLFLLANDLERDRSCGAKPQLSGRRSHRWARLSQLNPQAAGSDDAQDASYQQDVL